MALSTKTGGVAAVMGVLAGAATIIGALAEPETLACVGKVAGALGTHSAAVVGIIATVAPLVSYFSHAPGTRPQKDG